VALARIGSHLFIVMAGLDPAIHANKPVDPRDKGAAMVAWTRDELDRIGKAEELEIAALRPDGTLRKPVPV